MAHLCFGIGIKNGNPHVDSSALRKQIEHLCGFLLPALVDANLTISSPQMRGGDFTLATTAAEEGADSEFFHGLF